jgi:TRAP transporter 4TM/12TM fusion protein
VHERSLVVVLGVLRATILIVVVSSILNLPGRVGLGVFNEQLLMAVLGASLALTFLSFPLRSRTGEEALAEAALGPQRALPGVADVLAAGVALGACGYVAVRYPELIREWVDRPWHGVLLAALIVLLVFEASRRVTGLSLVLIVLALCLHALFGWMLPEQFASRPIGLDRLMVYLAVDTNALLGGPLDIAVRVVTPFVVLGHLLARAGGSEFFTEIALSLLGQFRGGAAKVAVLGSAFFGMLSGSAVANVASVGTLTIPMMTRAGFPRHLAAAVEAVGSTGGQVAPPVMGAAAFLMAEYLQVSYAEVALAALLPALLFFFALFMQVDLEAAKLGIRGVPRSELPSLAPVVRSGWYFGVPFLVLVVGLLHFQLEAELAALWAVVVLAGIALVVPRRGRRSSLGQIGSALLGAAGSMVEIIAITAISGLLIGALNLTGVAFSLTQQLLLLSAGSTPLLLGLTAFAAFLLGLPLPTVGVYVVLATLAAPALVEAGISPMAAHLFVLFNGMLGMVTPPVALAAFAAATIAQADTWKTGWAATRMSWFAYLIPFLFAYTPELLLRGDAIMIAWRCLATLLGMFLGTVAVVGFFRERVPAGQRALYGLVALSLLVQPPMFTGAMYANLVGAVAAATAIVWELSRTRLPASTAGDVS